MPIIRARTNRARSVRHICRLREPSRDALVLYARFVGDTVDYVVNQLIETTLAKDRDFLAWRAAHPDQTAAATPRGPLAATREADAAIVRGHRCAD